jgi:hypothetical protein
MVVYEVRAGRVEDAQNASGEVIGYIPERRVGMQVEDALRLARSLFRVLVEDASLITVRPMLLVVAIPCNKRG